jgi:hypothetical protein
MGRGGVDPQRPVMDRIDRRKSRASLCCQLICNASRLYSERNVRATPTTFCRVDCACARPFTRHVSPDGSAGVTGVRVPLLLSDASVQYFCYCIEPCRSIAKYQLCKQATVQQPLLGNSCRRNDGRYVFCAVRAGAI